MGSSEAIDFIFKNHPDIDTLFMGDKKHDSNTIQNVSALMVNFANEKTQQQTELIERLKGVLNTIISNPKELHSGGWYELDVPMEEITVAESLIEETK